MELAHVFGLKEEAIQSVQSLKTWQTALENENTKIRVVYGTKGGYTKRHHDP
ncbi:integrase domain-containing protein [uncultured Gilliamella sp.]|uniref:integrase domain-containing protein n=1 Tax=uncultured Gilliamella sp. TaxID=1193505 RepID=UPI003441353C